MSKQPQFVRALGLFDATSLVIGCIVGVGIFRMASSIAGYLDSPAMILALWLTGGLLSLCGALCYAELAAMFPKSGGDYVYISAIYGRFWGFLFGWTKLFVERTGTIAILGFVFAEYLSRVAGYGPDTARWVAAAGVAALTIINFFGIRWGTVVQNVFTVLKVGALVAIIGVGLWAGRGTETLFGSEALIGASGAGGPSGTAWTSFGVGLVFVIWAYSGWTEAGYVAEEIHNPQRNVPLAILIGVAATTVLYLLVNAVYLWYVPLAQMRASGLVAADMMQRALGTGGARFIAIMVACSAFGALNGYILTGARILYALGVDHPVFAAFGSLHPRFHTPGIALVVNAAAAILLICTRTFDQIAVYSTVAISLFFLLAVAGVIVLRRREPNRPRPYRAWGYPWTALVYLALTVAVMASVAVKEPREAAFGFGWVALGLPLYALSQRFHKKGSDPIS